MNIPRLMMVTDEDPNDFNILSTAIANGLPWLQLRKKRMSSKELYILALKLREITKRQRTLFTINSRLDIAIAVGADGVHLPEDSLPPHAAKSLARHLLIGVSIHSLEGAIKAQDEGADYIIAGPVFATPSKARYGAPLGLDLLKLICSRSAIPIIAIGGITKHLAKQCLDAGAHGVGGIREFYTEKD